MIRYRFDPDNLRRLTEEEAELDAAPIDCSDIPQLDDEFVAKTKRPITFEEIQRRRKPLR
jgi:hypothetical protein